MYEQSRDTKFKRQIRIKLSKLQYLRTLRIARTLAGTLDIIIEVYKEKEKQDELVKSV